MKALLEKQVAWIYARQATRNGALVAEPSTLAAVRCQERNATSANGAADRSAGFAAQRRESVATTLRGIAKGGFQQLYFHRLWVDLTVRPKSCRSGFKIAYREPKALGTNGSTTNPTTIMGGRYSRSTFSCRELPPRTILLAEVALRVARGVMCRPGGLL